MSQMDLQGTVAIQTSPQVALWRLYTLRICYLILVVGIGLTFWPNVLQHTSEFAATRGIQFSLLAGLGLTAVLGLRYPVRMIPLLLFELIWKIIYLIFFALPLWRAHQITEAVASDIFSVALVVIFLPLIPWGYVVHEFFIKRSERWR